MGYTTEFKGSFSFNKEVDEGFVNYINHFAKTRHMKLNVEEIKKYDPDWAEKCFNGEMGSEGQYYVGLDEKLFYKHDDNPYVVDNNIPPDGIPSLWCQWIIEDNELMWDGGEKFYCYVDWLRYLIENFIAPSGYVLNGEVICQGECIDDRRKIIVNANEIEVIELG